jgi:hypothetical protein
MRAMEEDIEQQLRPPCLLLKLVEEPHIVVACSTNPLRAQVLNVDQRRYRPVDAVVDE